MDQRKQYESLFPEYSFVNLVGQGYYGDVYFCIRKSDKKKVAIKVVCVCLFTFSIDSECER